MVIPSRAHLDSVKRLLRGDSLHRPWISAEILAQEPLLQQHQSVRTRSGRGHCWFSVICSNRTLLCKLRSGALSGTRFGLPLVVQTRGAMVTFLWKSSRNRTQLHTIVRNATELPQSLGVLGFMARLREEPDSDDGSGPDEGVPNKFAGHRGVGEPMQVGVGYTQRRAA